MLVKIRKWASENTWVYPVALLVDVICWGALIWWLAVVLMCI